MAKPNFIVIFSVGNFATQIIHLIKRVFERKKSMSKVKTTSRISIVRHLLLVMATATVAVGWAGGSSAVESISLESETVVVESDVTEIEFLVQQVHKGINEYRADRNLSPLRLNAQISQQAEIHSQNMAQQVVKFSHQGFKARIKALDGQIAYRRAAENVAYNQGYQDPARTAIAGWIESKGHHKNIVGDFNLTGIGVAKNEQGEYYFTQIFIKD